MKCKFQERKYICTEEESIAVLLSQSNMETFVPPTEFALSISCVSALFLLGLENKLLSCPNIMTFLNASHTTCIIRARLIILSMDMFVILTGTLKKILVLSKKQFYLQSM